MSALPAHDGAAVAPAAPAEVIPLVTRWEQERIDARLGAMTRADGVHYELEGCQPLSDRRPGWMLLADDECAHGRLPGDPTAPCECWGGR